MSKTPTLERRAAEIAGTEGDADDVELAALEHLRAVEAEGYARGVREERERIRRGLCCEEEFPATDAHPAIRSANK